LSSDVRVHVPATGLYTYPDLTVTCGEWQFQDNTFDTLLNPTLIVEILSPSTEAYDRGKKFEHYQTIESLTYYLLIAQDRIHVDLYTRQPSGAWLLTSSSDPNAAISLDAIGCTLPLSELYDGLEF
jgi:Uma2 family endonuclease